jgi:hypothetical protein
MPDIYLHLSGEQKGPFPAEQVRAMLASGEITPDTLAWHEGLSEWSRVGVVLGPPPAPIPGALPPLPPPPTVSAKKGLSGLVIALIIIGALAVLTIPCCCGIALGPVMNGIKKAKQNMALQESHAIGLAMFAYANDHNGHYPDAGEAPASSVVTIGNASPGATTSTEVFQKLIDEKYVTDPAIFYFAMPGKTKPVAGIRLTADNVCFDVTAGLTASSPGGIPLVYPTGYTVNFAPDIKVTRDAGAPYDGFIAFYVDNAARFTTVPPGGSMSLGPLDGRMAASLKQLKP